MENDYFRMIRSQNKRPFVKSLFERIAERII